MHENIPWIQEKYNYNPTRLYHLEPMRIGTPFVEGLVGYICRLADAHNINKAVLMSQEILPMRQNNLLYNAYRLSKQLNGYSNIAEETVHSLETLTGHSELSFLTTIPWRDMISQRKLIREYKAWCPRCYNEWAQTGNIMYDPLQWSLEIVQFCSRHQQPLYMNCPNCGKQMHAFSIKKAGYCKFCNGWLGVINDDFDNERLKNGHYSWYKWVGQNVNDLISYTQMVNTLINPKTMIINFKKCRNQVLRNFSQSTHGEISYSSMSQWIKGAKKPSLHGLLVISYLINTPVIDLINEDKDFNNIRGVTEEKPVMTSQVYYKKADLLLVEEELRKGFSEAASLEEVSRRVGVCSHTLRKFFPNLCKHIVDKRKQHRSETKEKLRLQKLKEVKEVTVKLYTEGIYPSYKTVKSQLSWKPQRLMGEQLDELRKAKKELGLIASPDNNSE